MDDNIYQLIESYIENSGMSQSAFSRKCGLPKQTINNLLKKRNNFQINILYQITDAFPDFAEKVILPTFGKNSLIEQPKKEKDCKISEIEAKDKLIYFLEKEIEQLKTENENLKNQCKKPVEIAQARV